MNRVVKLSGLIIVLFIVLAGCNRKTDKHAGDDTVHSGHEVIAVDESFKPVIEAEAQVFEGIFKEAKPEFRYQSENALLRSFLNDTVRVAVLSRMLDTNEVNILKSRTLVAETFPIAVDAIALIVNQASSDTLITVKDLKNLLNGNTKTDKALVFDNPNSSLVRYLKEFSGGKLQQKNIYALKSNKEVLNYVSTHTNAIGIIGFSWLNDPDPDYADAVNKVKVVGVKDEANKKFPNEYFKPSQTSLALKQYPLSRRIYLINSTGKMGLGRGFAEFVTNERGQRIILKSGVLPDSIPHREIHIKE
ncbi:substrate-binding domain-containing protein [Mucilaginibacter sp. RS28]|uniref:Substrate-binding domain-containing protein n=1 Tax=Mucilaginibacter straminoryzae TaxID=2932774 RepID=A0A9X1X4E5_9SPHI|nr:substrate-binding domain-containing protein [Mucilaginibacter straminoryzae]MCJ8210776.1 substrate-binding domain-containing protein [Mucilaginibacter straminoryzae]